MVDMPVIPELYRYNRWANDRMLEAVSSLTQAEFTRNLASSYPSVRDTVRRDCSKHYYRTAPSTAELSVPPTESRSTCSRKGVKPEIGSSGWTRTSNPPVNSRMLCH
jgi:hypothetical protein